MQVHLQRPLAGRPLTWLFQLESYVSHGLVPQTTELMPALLQSHDARSEGKERHIAAAKPASPNHAHACVHTAARLVRSGVWTQADWLI